MKTLALSIVLGVGTLIFAVKGCLESEKQERENNFGAIMLQDMDLSVDPCEDFNKYICGGYFKNVTENYSNNATVPSFMSRPAEENKATMLKLIESINETNQNSFKWKLKAAFEQCVQFHNTSGSNDENDAAKEFILKTIEDFGGWEPIGIPQTISFIEKPKKTVAAWIAGKFLNKYLGNWGGLLRFTEVNGEIIIMYSQNLQVPNWDIVLKQFGRTNNESCNTTKIEEFVELWNTEFEKLVMGTRNYHKLMDMFELEGFDWKTFIETAMEGNARVNMGWKIMTYVHPKEISDAIANVLTQVDIETIYDFYMAKMIAQMHERYVKDAASDNETESVESKCYDYIDGTLSIGTTYLLFESKGIKESLPQLQMIAAAIVDEYRNLFRTVSYFDDDAKQRYLDKLNTLTYNMMFPPMQFPEYAYDEFYAGIALHDTWMETDKGFIRQENKQFIEGITTPWQLSETGFGAGEINAFYSSEDNSFMMLSGLILSPFFDSKFPLLYNFAMVGEVVGHEIGHAFDANLFHLTWDNKNVSLPHDVASRWEAEQECMVSLYDNVCFEIDNETLCTNGTTTIGENIADQLGLRMTYRAFHNMVAQRNLSGSIGIPGMEGFTTEQQFFIALNKNNCGYLNDLNNTKERLEYDPHTLPGMRVEGAMKNLPEFSKAFNCKPGQKYNPEKRCTVYSI